MLPNFSKFSWNLTRSQFNHTPIIYRKIIAPLRNLFKTLGGSEHLKNRFVKIGWVNSASVVRTSSETSETVNNIWKHRFLKIGWVNCGSRYKPCCIFSVFAWLFPQVLLKVAFEITISFPKEQVSLMYMHGLLMMMCHSHCVVEEQMFARKLIYSSCSTSHLPFCPICISCKIAWLYRFRG